MTNEIVLREEVRLRYAEAATTVTTGDGAACDCCHPGIHVRRRGPRVRT